MTSKDIATLINDVDSAWPRTAYGSFDQDMRCENKKLRIALEIAYQLALLNEKGAAVHN